VAQTLSGVDTGAAMLAQSFFARELLRVGYDIMLRPIGMGVRKHPPYKKNHLTASFPEQPG